VASVAATPCPVLPLPASFDDYLGSLPKKRRQSVRRSLKRLEAGEVRIRSIDDASDLERTLVRWQAMRVEQYRRRPVRINPIHVSDSYRAFLVAALSDMTGRGEARVHSVEHGDTVVGVYVTLYDDRAAYAYQGGYDIAVANLGIGKIVDALVIRTGIGDGKRALDFGRGREPYKYWYGARDQEAVAVLCGHTGARSTLAYGSRSVSLKLGGMARALRRRGVSQRPEHPYP
jgi:CelD/BcsL family acetyltransferase involved in cellulose biosynthesis